MYIYTPLLYIYSPNKIYLMTKQNITTFFMLAIVCVALTACAQTKKSTSDNTRKNTATNGKPVLLQATQQTTLPGRPETEPTTDNRFVIVWKSKDAPASFFWRGNQSWLPCDVTKITNYKPLVISENDNGMPTPLNYAGVNTGAQDFKAGDTLELYPVMGGKHPIPDGIPQEKNNVIYYKTINSTWLALPVDSITVLPSIAMP